MEFFINASRLFKLQLIILTLNLLLDTELVEVSFLTLWQCIYAEKGIFFYGFVQKNNIVDCIIFNKL